MLDKRKRLIIWCVAVAAVAVLATLAIVYTSQVSNSNQPETTDSADTSSLTTPTVEDRVFSSSRDLSNYLAEQKSQETTIPDIDWAQQSVALVTYFAPSSGYSITSAEYKSEGGKDVVALEVQGPGTNCVVKTAFETVYMLAPVPKNVTSFETSVTISDIAKSCVK